LAPDREESRLATLGLTLIGFAFSGYLTYRELFSIHAICEWCASSAGIMTVLMGLSVWRFLRGDVDSREITLAPSGEPEPAAPPLGAAPS
jgi:vitamin K epoxide reductase family protein